MQRFLIVCAAGGLGSGARYLVSLWVDRPNSTLPWGTLIVNVIGSFMIALVLELAMRDSLSADVSLALTTGFMGGFTTYSAFNFQTTVLASNGHFDRAAINVIVTVGGCLVAGMGGAWLGRWFGR